MKTETIHTLHPDPAKTNKTISLAKYEQIRAGLLLILAEHVVSHTELMEMLYQSVKETFVGGVQWYGETVKPQKYKLVSKTS